MVNVGQAKTDLSQLLAKVEAGETVEIARHGQPVARLVPIVKDLSPGTRFISARGSAACLIRIGPDFEFTEDELADILDNPVDPLDPRT